MGDVVPEGPSHTPHSLPTIQTLTGGADVMVIEYHVLFELPLKTESFMVHFIEMYSQQV